MTDETMFPEYMFMLVTLPEKMYIEKIYAWFERCMSDHPTKTISKYPNPEKTMTELMDRVITEKAWYSKWFDQFKGESINSDKLGTDKCDWCGGSGQMVKTNYQGDYPEKYDCPVCNGTGKFSDKRRTKE